MSKRKSKTATHEKSLKRGQKVENEDTLESQIDSTFHSFRDLKKLVNKLPLEEYDYYHNTYEGFKMKMEEFGKRILGIGQKIVDNESKISANLSGIMNSDDAIQSYRHVVNVIDDIVQRVDPFVDHARGLVSNPSSTPLYGCIQVKGKTQLFYASNVNRPQQQWEDTIDNTQRPFVSPIREKPNALVPLNDVYLHAEKNKLQNDNTITSYPHPYQYELERLSFDRWNAETKEEQLYKGFDDTKVYWIDNKEKLENLSQKLDNVSEFAVDIEAHMYRSFQGFSCLIQISTRDEDFLIDCIELRKHIHILNSSFTNPNITKVFHGADMDIQWLQRDFGVYVVNLFDTGQACRVLNFPSLALSYLLKYYCSISVDKQYQRADWRMRPLPEEMLKYAREDTHYLLYIYDRLRNELISKSREDTNLLKAVFDRSKEICLVRYEKELLTEESFLKLYNKFNVVYNPQQLRVFEALYNWRDRIARREDESTRFVLPNHMLFHIAENIPEDKNSLYALCNPIPPLLKMHCLEVIDIIKLALKKIPILQENQTPSRPIESGPKKIDLSITSTEQLCKEAGWIEEYETHDKVSRQVHIPTISTDSSVLSGTVVLGEFEDENENQATLEDIKKSFSVDLFVPKFVEPPVEDKPVPTKSKPKEKKVKPKESNDLFVGIPASMQEVYKMANTNKKKKKKRDNSSQNKPARESMSPFYINDGNEEQDIRKKRQKTSDKPIKEILRGINWDGE